MKLDKPIRIIIENEQKNNFENRNNKTTQKFSGIVVDTKQNKDNIKSQKVSRLDTYAMEHPSEFYIENIDEFYKNARLINNAYRPTKQQVITLINIILKCKTFENVKKELNCADSTLGRYLANLTKMGITTGDYKNGIKINDKLIIKKFFKKY